MTDLTQLFPTVAPVSFAGRTLSVRPLRLRQLAELQGWLNMYVPNPAEAARAKLAAEDLDDEARRKLLVNAYLDAERWPCQIGSAVGDYLLDTERGRMELLSVATGHAAAQVVSLAADATDEDWRRLDRACFGSDPLMTLARMMDPLAFAGDREDRTPINWCKLVCEAAKDGSWTIEEVGELTLGQLAAFRSAGVASVHSVPPRPGETVAEAADRRAAYFDLGDDGEGVANGD